MAKKITSPNNLSEYLEWLKNKHTNYTKAYHNLVIKNLKQDFEKSPFWIDLTDKLKDYNQEYQLKTGYDLLLSEQPPCVLVKSYESFINKTYRKNFIENKNSPNEPEGGWYLQENWLSRINDIIRTLVVVKYFDGVTFINERIKSLCEQNGLECRIDMEAKEEGYYASHIYTKMNFEIPRLKWDTEQKEINIEIQITTQLQEVIRKLLHKYYEKNRVSKKTNIDKWQWDHKTDEFAANYLGHILHYIEGMIMEIREKQKGG